MSGIRKVQYRKEEPGRPKDVKIHSEKVGGVEIVGGHSRQGQVRIMDARHGDEAPPPQFGVTRDKEEFQKIKEGEEEE